MYGQIRFRVIDGKLDNISLHSDKENPITGAMDIKPKYRTMDIRQGKVQISLFFQDEAELRSFVDDLYEAAHQKDAQQEATA